MLTEKIRRVCTHCLQGFYYERPVGRAGRLPNLCGEVCRRAAQELRKRGEEPPAPPSSSIPCPNCGFDYTPVKGRKYCSRECGAAGSAESRRRRPSKVKDQRTYLLLREITTLRLAVETARARLAMGVYGDQCGLDNPSAARRVALAELDAVCAAHDDLARTRKDLDLPKLRVEQPRSDAVIDLTERQDTNETMAS